MPDRVPFSDWQNIELRTDEACRAADLASIMTDLRLVVRWCELYESGEFEDDVVTALWEAVVVAYGRCFTVGRDSLGRAGRRRQVTDAELAVLTDEQMTVHRAVKAERNRHVGHRDDQLGEISQVFRFVGEADAAGVTAVGMTTWRRHGPATYEVAEVRHLAERLHGYLESIYDVELEALNQ